MPVQGPLGEPIEILLVEDNPGDARLTKEALAEGRIANRLTVVTDGVQAIEFLRGLGRFEGVPRPDLVLLDLNLPKMSGLEVLAEVKKDPELSVIPVVVLTTSSADEDILGSYKLHANAFITKPVEFDKFLEAVRAAGDFYINIVRLPPNEPSGGHEPSAG